MPVVFNLSDASICNLTCPHCPIHGTDELHMLHNSRMLDMELGAVAALLDSALPTATYFHLTVAGEPFYSQNFDIYVEKAVVYQMKVQVVTNGTLLRKSRLIELLPFLHSVGFSIDGANEVSFETLRRGAKFNSVLRNIDLIIRTSKKVQAPATPVFYISFTIMASNLVELPQIIRLAHHLGIPIVQAYFIKPPFEWIECERPSQVKPLYNAMLMEALEVARELGIVLSAPNAFPGVAPFREVSIPSGCILAHLPNDRGQQSSFAAIYDADEVEREATELAEDARRIAAHRDAAPGILSESALALWDELSLHLDEKVRVHDEVIRYYQANPESTVPWCNFIEDSMYLDKFKTFLCCIEGSPNVEVKDQDSVIALWNHETLRNFRGEFLTESVPSICSTCHERRSIPAKVLLHEVLAVISAR